MHKCSIHGRHSIHLFFLANTKYTFLLQSITALCTSCSSLDSVFLLVKSIIRVVTLVYMYIMVLLLLELTCISWKENEIGHLTKHLINIICYFNIYFCMYCRTPTEVLERTLKGRMDWWVLFNFKLILNYSWKTIVTSLNVSLCVPNEMSSALSLTFYEKSFQF